MKHLVTDLAARLRPGHAHTWQTDLSGIRTSADAALDTLSLDERVRAERYVLAIDRERFIFRRYMLRHLLSHYVDIPPEQLRFRYGAAGKPELDGDGGRSAIQFNLTHSGSIALCVVACDRDVGVDVERVRPDVPVEVVDCFFSRQEAAAFLRCPPELQRAAFFACWTRKEACLKAVGLSLSELNRVNVPVTPLMCSLNIRQPGLSGRSWRLHDIRTYEGYRAVLVVEDPVHIADPVEWCDSNFEASDYDIQADPARR